METFLDIIKNTPITLGTATKSVYDGTYANIRTSNFNMYVHEWSLDPWDFKTQEELNLGL
jgi:hypothetical protein